MPNPMQMTVAEFSPERMSPYIGKKVLVTITRPASAGGTQLMSSVSGVLAGAHRRNYMEAGGEDAGAWPTLWSSTGRLKSKFPCPTPTRK